MAVVFKKGGATFKSGGSTFTNKSKAIPITQKAPEIEKEPGFWGKLSNTIKEKAIPAISEIEAGIKKKETVNGLNLFKPRQSLAKIISAKTGLNESAVKYFLPGFGIDLTPSESFGGIVKAPLQFGAEAAQSVEDKKAVKTVANTAFGIASTVAPTMMLFNAAANNEEVKPVLDEIFNKYEEGKNKIASTKLGKKLGRAIGEEGRDLVDVATDVAPFILLHKAIFGGGSGAKKVKLPKEVRETLTPKEIKVAEEIGGTTLKESTKEVYNKVLNSEYLKDRFGEPGKKLYENIREADKRSAIGKAGDILDMQEKIKGMTDKELANFKEVSEGKAKPINSKVADAFGEWDRIRTNIATRAQKAGLTIKDSLGIEREFVPRKDYFPKFIKEDKLLEVVDKPAKLEKMLEKMVEEKKARNVADAQRIFDKYIADRKTNQAGPLERARESLLPDEFFETDPRRVLRRYIDKSHERLSDAELFGPKYELATDLIEQARTKGVDIKTMQEIFDRAVGREKFNPAMEKLSRTMRAWQLVTKLGLVAITNIGDIVKPFVRTDIRPTMKAIVQSFTKAGKERGVRAGTIVENLRRMEAEAGVETPFTQKFIKAVGFEATEKFLRTVGVNAGRNYAEILLSKLKKNPNNKFARRRLEQFNVDVDKALKEGKFTEKELTEIGYEAVSDMQPMSRVDVPFYWQSPGGKLLTQFKSFAFKQAKFLNKFVFQELKKGNTKPLLTFLILGQVVGEGVGDLKSFVRGRDRDKTWRRMIDNYMTIGGVGLATDFLSSVQYGTFGGGPLKFMAGPTLTEADEVLTTLFNPTLEKIGKKSTSLIPVVGAPLKNILFPTKQKYKARTIPIAEDIFQLMQNK